MTSRPCPTQSAIIEYLEEHGPSLTAAVVLHVMQQRGCTRASVYQGLSSACDKEKVVHGAFPGDPSMRYVRVP